MEKNTKGHKEEEEEDIVLEKRRSTINKKREIISFNLNKDGNISIKEAFHSTLDSYIKKFPTTYDKKNCDNIQNRKNISVTIDCNLVKTNNDFELILRLKDEAPYEKMYFKSQDHIHPFFTLDGEKNLLDYFPHSPFIVKPQDNTPKELTLPILLGIASTEKDKVTSSESNYNITTTKIVDQLDKNEKTSISTNEEIKVLIFTPHQDDEVLGASALINILVKEKVGFRVIYMTSGKGGGNAEVRQKEAKNGLKVLGASEENCLFYDFPFYNDTKREVTERDLEYLHGIFKQFSPKSVFICADVFDPNKSHRKCYDILLNYFNNFSFFNGNTSKDYKKEINILYKEIFNFSNLDFKVFFYFSVWYWPKENEVNYILPYDFSVFKLKVSAMLEHTSQIENDFMGADDRPFYERATHRDKWFGKKYSKKYCEIFYLVNN